MSYPAEVCGSCLQFALYDEREEGQGPEPLGLLDDRWGLTLDADDDIEIGFSMYRCHTCGAPAGDRFRVLAAFNGEVQA